MSKFPGKLAFAAVFAAFCCMGPVLAAEGVVALNQAQPGTAAPATSSYSDFVLGPTDKIRVIIYGEDGLNTQPEYIVSAAGKVSLPLVGDVQAAGLPIAQFQAEVENAYRTGYLADPKISIEVIAARPFFILGEVKNPGQYPYTPGLTIMNAVAIAGGFTYRAMTDNVEIRHANENAERDYAIKNDTSVAPGDTIRIKERWF